MRNKQGLALGQASMLIIALIAFAYIIGETNMVEGQEEAPLTVESYDLTAGQESAKVTSGGYSNLKKPSNTPGPTTAITAVSAVSSFTNGGNLVASNDILKAGQVIAPKGTVFTPTTQAGVQGMKATVNGKEVFLPDSEAKALLNPAEGATQGLEAPTSENMLSKFLGASQGGVADILLSGLMWAGIAYGAGMFLGGILGLEEDQTQALSTSLAAGAFTYQALATGTGANGALGSGEALGMNFAGAGSTGVVVAGLAVAVIVFLVMYKDTETKIVSFKCQAWQAPNGGDNCELCNDDNLPCSEYRCRSLGANCELVNKGSTQEKCVNINPRDVNPPIITPNKANLTSGHDYKDVKNSPPGPGFRIINKNSTDGCLKAFTPLTFGIMTDEPSQCKIDYKSTQSYEDMTAYMGGDNAFSYNHTEVFSLPGAKAFANNSNFKLENGKDLVFYIRCRDRGSSKESDKPYNVNDAEYAVKFCMDPTPDTTPAKIVATSVQNGGCVSETTTTATVDFYTDEPADCKWSHTDQNYDQMQNSMACSMNLYQLNSQQLFTCKAQLSGIARDNTDFFVRCKDQPGMADINRNKNSESYKFSLRTSNALKLKNVRPNSTIFGGVSPSPIELYTETLFGCEEGKAVCYYSTINNSGDYIKFFDTDNTDGINTQRQDLQAGNYKYYIKCVDSGGNVAETSTEFSLDIDTSAPVIARVYEEENMLKVITVRESECSYTHNDCDFTFSEGINMPYANSTVHVSEWNKDKTYYIKCRDQYLNEPATCSAVVKPSEKFVK